MINPFHIFFSTLTTLHEREGMMERDIHLARDIAWGIIRADTPGLPPLAHPWVSTVLDVWRSDLSMLIAQGPDAMGYRDRFFRRIASPILQARRLLLQHQNPHRIAAAKDYLANCVSDCELKIAMEVYLTRLSEEARNAHQHLGRTVEKGLPPDVGERSSTH